MSPSSFGVRAQVPTAKTPQQVQYTPDKLNYHELFRHFSVGMRNGRDYLETIEVRERPLGPDGRPDPRAAERVYPFSVPVTVVYTNPDNGRTTEYRRGTRIGKGAYGLVYEYSTQAAGLPPVIAIKTATGLDEETALEQLVTHPRVSMIRNWGLLRVGSAGAGYTYTLMPKYDGTLQDFCSHSGSAPAQRLLTPSEILNVIGALLQCLKELDENGFTYMDIKPANVFYYTSTAGAAPIEIVMGDIGSVGSARSMVRKKMAATFPPPEESLRVELPGWIPQSVPSMLWAVGITMLYLTGANNSQNRHMFDFQYMKTTFKTAEKSYASGFGVQQPRSRTAQRVRVKAMTEITAIVSRQSPTLLQPLLDLMGTTTSPATLTLQQAIDKMKEYEDELDGVAPQTSAASQRSMSLHEEHEVTRQQLRRQRSGSRTGDTPGATRQAVADRAGPSRRDTDAMFNEHVRKPRAGEDLADYFRNVIEEGRS